MKNRLIALVEQKQISQVKTYKLKEKDKSGTEVEKTIDRKIDEFEIGDTVDVSLRILEGQKERIQVFNGTVIARKGEGLNEMFTVRRIVQGEGVERQFPLYSPRVAAVEVKRSGVTRRAKLYYLRDRVGKATRLRERKGKGGETPSKSKAKAGAAPTSPAPEKK
jgi:large subunit ribosomal protein L19